MVFSHSLKPFPEKIGQSDKQLVVYNGNTVIYSPYVVKEQKTSVKLASSTIESYSRLKPSSSSDNTITYGPYKDSNAYRTHAMRIHCENNSPFLTVNEMTRWIELSHWGNIAIEETYHTSHQGAELKVCVISYFLHLQSFAFILITAREIIHLYQVWFYVYVPRCDTNI